MASNDPKLITLLEARLDRFEKDLKQAGQIADREVRNIEDRFARMNLGGPQGFINNFGKSFLAATLGAVGLESAIRGVRNAIKEVDDLGDMSERIGVSTDAIQTLKHVLGQSGGEAEVAEKALDKFSDTVAEAALSGNYLSQVFKANGIAMRDANGELRKNEELLVDVAKLIAGLQSEQERINLATDFFGRQAGPQMVGTLLRISNEGLPALIQGAKDAGVVLDKELIEKAGELDKEFRKVEERISTGWKRLSIEFGGPLLIEAIDGVTIAIRNMATAWALLSDGRIREATGFFITRLEAAKQRMAILGNLNGSSGIKPMTQAEADEFSKLNPNLEKPSTRVVITKPTVLPPKGDTGAGEGLDAFERQVAAIEKRTAVLKAETEVIDQGTAARERARVVAELETAAKKANEEAGLKNTEVTKEQRDKINELADAYLKVAKAAEDANSPLRQFGREANDTAKALSQVGVAGLRSLEDGMVEVIKKTATVGEAFTRMTDSIMEDILRLLIRKAILAPLSGTLDSALAGLPGFANGTSSAPGGLAVVGERGPEVVNLPKGAQVIPNHMLGRGGSTPVKVNLTVIEDTSRAGQTEQRNDNGSVDLVAYVDSVTAKNASRPGSATSNALNQRNRITRR